MKYIIMGGIKMNKITKKGFTLIELMIVLAIIAILAVVLVPKAGQMKDNARNAGVTTNVNAVRGILESKVVDTAYLGQAATTRTLLFNTFKGDNALANPFNANGITVATKIDVNRTLSASVDDSIVVYNFGNPSIPSPLTALTNINSGNKGKVFIYVYADGYVVFGVDNTLSASNIAIIK
jgi:type IV pilus assembly protein PilA